jgi:hypothetical protein
MAEPEALLPLSRLRAHRHHRCGDSREPAAHPLASNAPPLYDGIFSYIAPLAIFFLLLDVRLRDVRLAGPAMLLTFGLGAVATMVGSVAGFYIIAPQDHGITNGPVLAGMFTGTYIGGSVNLNAVALQYGVTKEGTLVRRAERSRQHRDHNLDCRDAGAAASPPAPLPAES